MSKEHYEMLKGIFRRVTELFGLHQPLTEDFYAQLEEALVSSDVSVRTAAALADYLRSEARRRGVSEVETARSLLKERLTALLSKEQTAITWPQTTPGLFLMIGVNGTGKTTTIAKLAHRAKKRGLRPILAAGDTFRAAASEQLEEWGRRLEVEVIRGRSGGDPAAVVFDSLQAAAARGADLVIADTAGRLHTKRNLMEELGKIGRVSKDKLGRPPEEILLVLDATTGQNALAQAKEFQQAVGLTGIILTKLDTAAKGGIVITIADELGLPIKCIGTGEQPQDLEDFDPRQFVEAILGNSQQAEAD
jgi:fused signal recognition particle receptor